MELALYCPNCGYYETEEDIIGRGGDYYTSVNVGSLLGELLAFQFAEWLEEIQERSFNQSGLNSEGKLRDGSGVLRIVEAGAHGGDLAGDILNWLRDHRAELFGRLEYWIVEPSARRQVWQQRKLSKYGNTVRWARDLAEVTGVACSDTRIPRSAGLRGIMFSNELLDSMPVHRLGWDAKARVWFEWGVTLQAGQLVWTRMPGGATANGSLQANPRESSFHFPLSVESGVMDALPDGFITELCPAAEEWWRSAALSLAHGKLLALDYGILAEEFFMPERKEGTIRGYLRHRLADNLLANPGGQDLTAHVNFTAIRTAGESAGLRTDVFLNQAQFLTSIAAQVWQKEGAFGEWSPERTRQFQTLTHPEHLGRAFRVLVQARAGRLAC